MERCFNNNLNITYGTGSKAAFCAVAYDVSPQTMKAYNSRDNFESRSAS